MSLPMGIGRDGGIVQGLGLEYAKSLAKAGCRCLVLTGRSPALPLETLANFAAAGVTVFTVRLPAVQHFAHAAGITGFDMLQVGSTGMLHPCSIAHRVQHGCILLLGVADCVSGIADVSGLATRRPHCWLLSRAGHDRCQAGGGLRPQDGRCSRLCSGPPAAGVPNPLLIHISSVVATSHRPLHGGKLRR
jgi:hypothetical protein